MCISIYTIYTINHKEHYASNSLPFQQLAAKPRESREGVTYECLRTTELTSTLYYMYMYTYIVCVVPWGFLLTPFLASFAALLLAGLFLVSCCERSSHDLGLFRFLGDRVVDNPGREDFVGLAVGVELGFPGIAGELERGDSQR